VGVLPSISRASNPNYEKTTERGPQEFLFFEIGRVLLFLYVSAGPILVESLFAVSI